MTPDVFAILRETLLEKAKHWVAEDFLVRGIWKVELAFKPNPIERTFQYTFWIAMTRGQGCCYCTGDDPRGRELVGSDARDLMASRTCISIAALDSLYASVSRSPAAVHELRGNSIEKTKLRTGILVAETERLLGQFCRTDRKPRVVNVGVVGNLVEELAARGCEVLATDLEPDMIGKVVSGVEVQDGTRTFDFVRDADLAVVTGMTIATDSLDIIISEAKQAGTKLLVFAETGANFGEEYCRTLGVDTVVSEPFPFYIFQGLSTIEVYRRG